MADIERLARTHIALADAESLEAITHSIASGETGLVPLVKALGEYLLSEEDAVRLKGVTLLSDVLGKVPTEVVNRQATQVLATFYTSKLSDPPLLVPALEGLNTLARLPTYGALDTKSTILALFTNLRPLRPHLPQTTRYLFFTLLDTLVARHRDALKSMGDEFLDGYISLAEGEKDPRNLIVAFGIGRVLLVEFETERKIEGFFDIIYCYFPITFRPPPDDPYGISAEDLRMALRQCMAATPHFAPQAMPLFMEKLSAAAGPTKRDTLQSIAVCLPVFGKAQVEPWAEKLWAGLNIEILYSTDADTESDALAALASLIDVLYPPSSTADIGIASKIVPECVAVLSEPEKSKAGPAAKVLGSLVESSPVLARPVLDATIPPLLELYAVPNEPSQRASILNHIHALLIALSNTYPAKLPPSAPAAPPSNTTTSSPSASLRSYIDDAPLPESLKDHLVSTLISGMDASAFRAAATAVFTQTLRIEGFWSADEVSVVAERLGALVENDSVRMLAIEGLLCLPASILEDTVVPRLAARLPDLAPIEWSSLRATLATLATLCADPTLFETLVVRLSSKLELLCTPGAETSDDALAYVHALLATLHAVLERKVAAGHPDVGKYIDRLVPRVFGLFVGARGTPLASDERLLKMGGKVVEVVVRILPAERQEKFAHALFAAFRKGNVDSIVHEASRLESDGLPFLPFEPGVPAAQRALVPLFASALIALRKEVRLPEADLSQFVGVVLEWGFAPQSTPLETLASYQIVASLINKRADDLVPFLQSHLPAFWISLIASPTAAISQRAAALRAWAWIAKALVVRSHPLGYELTERVLELFAEPGEIGECVAPAEIGFVAKEEDAGLLGKAGHAVVRLLYKQKFYSRILPRVVCGYDKASASQQPLYLAALASLLQHMPKQLALTELPQLMPLLLLSLALPDANLRANVINTLTVLVKEEDSVAPVIAEHISTLVPALLRNSKFTLGSTAKLRTSALRCLASFPDAVRKDVLQSYKTQAVRELSIALDDRKRDVRREAVDTRDKWINLG